MSYVKNLTEDEIRCNFFVPADLKRMWNTQIGLIKEVQRICEKYNLRFFAGYGTLLGAVRHQGYIPWDNDVDLMMFRDDYEKFKVVAPTEFHYPYYCDIYYENEYVDYGFDWHFPSLPFIKIRDERTTLQCKDKVIREAIAIDIFALDSFPPFEDQSKNLKHRALYELAFAACWQSILKQMLETHNESEFFLGKEFLEKIMQLPYKNRSLVLEEEFTKFYHQSKHVSVIYSMVTPNVPIYERAWFDETIYLPFEEVSVPAPKEFEKVLAAYYGADWNIPKIYGAYSSVFSVDIPYKVFHSEKNYRIGKNFDELRNGTIIRVSRKKFRRVQLNLIEKLKQFGLKFFAMDQTLYTVANYQGFDVNDDFITLGMPKKDFEKLSELEINFPYRFDGRKFSNDLTSMITSPDAKNIPQGIFIEIIPVDYDPEVIHLRFENISMPVPKNYSELLKKFVPNPRKVVGDISADISWEEYFSKVTKIFSYNTGSIISLEK